MLVALFFFFRDGERMSARHPRPPPDGARAQGRGVRAPLRHADGRRAEHGRARRRAGRPRRLRLLGDRRPAVRRVPRLPDRRRVVPAALRRRLRLGAGAASTCSPPARPRAASACSVWGLLVVSLSDNVIRPLIIGGRARLPTFLLLFAHPGRASSVYGFLGVFLGPGDPGRAAVVRRHLPRPVRRDAGASAAGPVAVDAGLRRLLRHDAAPQDRLRLRDDLAQDLGGRL